ncbi:MAG: DUF2157 domain-containing protein [Phycisphaerae bacterium]
MSPNSSARAQALFQQATALPAAQVDAFLQQACRGDAALHQEVQALVDLARRAKGMAVPPRPVESDPPLAETAALVGSPASRARGGAAPQIPGYEILRELGQGGMGVVYQARDLRLDRLVAVKTLTADDRSAERLELLRREARLAARLHHPNIVAIHALLEDGDPPCVAMEWVDGVPLDVAARRMDFREIARTMIKVGRAVDYAHEKGVVHRDLKPGNILLDRDGEPRLLDFGLARAIARAPTDSSMQAIKGTPLFMAPEQFLSPTDVGPAADIFALGLVLYALLTGGPPPHPSGQFTPQAWANRDLPLPRQINPDIPEALQRICLTACEPLPEDRYSSAARLTEDLQRFLEDRPVHGRPTRYAQLLEDRVRVHIDALTEWQSEHLITRREADSLQERYLRLLFAESLWVPGARRLRVGPVLVQVGGWLVVISTILWMAFYWRDLSALKRVFAVGVPALIINGAAFALWKRSNELLALLFSVVGTLLVPLFASTVLFELNLLSTRSFRESGGDGRLVVHALLRDTRQADVTTLRDTGESVRAVVPIERLRTDYELLPGDYFTNRQRACALWLATAYACALLSQKRYALLSATLCVLLVFAYSSLLFLLGLKAWLLDERFARAALAFVPVLGLAYLLARRLDRPGLEHLAGPFYATAGIGIPLVLGVLAMDVPKSGWHLSGPGLNQCRELLFSACGVLFFVIAWLHDRSGRRLRRIWGNLYFKLVPPCLVVPIDFLSHESLWSLGKLGGAEFEAAELAIPLLCAILIVVGTINQLRWFTYYGLLHLAIFLVLTTDRHFRLYLRWPMVVVVLGAVAILIGLWLEHWRSTHQRAVKH